MSERLEEMKDKYLKAIPFETINGINVIAVDKKDFDWLIKQAGRFEAYVKETAKAHEQNKRYRDLFGRLLNSEIDDAEEYADLSEQTAWEALESESNE